MNQKMSESSFVMEDNWRQRKSLMLIRKRAYLENCVSPAQMLLRRLFKPPEINLCGYYLLSSKATP